MRLPVPSPLALALLLAASPSQAQVLLDFELVNRTILPAALQANGHSEAAVDASSDGRFALFTSAASNLVGSDGNLSADAFRYDRQTHSLLRVSVAADGHEGDGPASAGALSQDGQTAVFSSRARNLLPADTDAQADLYLKSLSGQSLQLLTPGGADGDALDPDGSSDLRFITYTRRRDGRSQIELLDRQAGGAALVLSRALDLTPGNADSGHPSISADGQFVLFESRASNLDAADANAAPDVFLYERAGGVLRRISTPLPGGSDNGAGSGFGLRAVPEALSADGRFAVFTSAAPLAPSDADVAEDVYLYDRVGNTLALFNAAQVDGLAVLSARAASISDDGAQVVYAALLQRGDGSRFQATVQQSRDGSGALRVISRRADGSVGDGGGGAQSGNGTAVYYSDQWLSEPEDRNGFRDLRVVTPGQVGTAITLALGGDSQTGTDQDSLPHGLSDDGRWVSFDSAASNQDPDPRALSAVYLRDRFSNITRRLTALPDGAVFDCPSAGGRMSSNANVVVFDSCTDPFATPHGPRQIWRHVRASNAVEIVSVDAQEMPGSGGDSRLPAVSHDGGVYSWISDAPNLTGAAATDRTPRLVIRRFGVPERRIFPQPPLLPDCATDFLDQRLSRDGNLLFFASCARNFGPGPLNAGTHVYALPAGGNLPPTLVSPADVAAGTHHRLHGVSADGRFVLAMQTHDDPQLAARLLLFDRVLGVGRVLSDALLGTPNLALVAEGDAALSPDARYALLPVRTLEPPGQPVLLLLDLLDSRQLLLEHGIGNPYNDRLFQPILAIARARMVFASSADNTSTEDRNGHFVDVNYIENLAPPQQDQLLRNGFEF